jgi:hypothetical protein
VVLFSELAAVLGYFFGVIMAFTAVVALAVGLFNITGAVNGRQRPRPVIGRTVVRDANGQELAYVYSEEEPQRRAALPRANSRCYNLRVSPFG